jgi:hypothetical protein
MAKRTGRIGLATLLLGLLLPLPAWAGSAQAALTVAVVVPARCAIQVPGSMAAQAGTLGTNHEGVAMRCTKGTLPTSSRQAGPSAAGPRITRDLVTAASLQAPRPQTEAGATTVTEAIGPRVVVTVNF